MKDLVTGDITLASTSDSGVKGNGCSIGPSLSADGTQVAFYSSATNLDPADTDAVQDMYVKDLVTGDITLASTSDTGVKGNSDSFGPSLSTDGTKVAFDSVASNLDPADTDTVVDIYVKDLVTGDITLASTSDTGVKGNGDSFDPSLSADGTKVAFHSVATNLDPADTDTCGRLCQGPGHRGYHLGLHLRHRREGQRPSSVPSVFRPTAPGGVLVLRHQSGSGRPDRISDVYVKELGEPASSTDHLVSKSNGPRPGSSRACDSSTR